MHTIKLVSSQRLKIERVDNDNHIIYVSYTGRRKKIIELTNVNLRTYDDFHIMHVRITCSKKIDVSLTDGVEGKLCPCRI
jgi:hypothetical protein